MTFYSTLPTLSTDWPDADQSRKQTVEDVRRILGIEVTVQTLGELITAMNTVGELSEATVTTFMASLTEYKALEIKKIEVQSESAFTGAAPIKKADVVEFDTSLLAAGTSVEVLTKGIDARMAEIVGEMKVALGLCNGKATAQARMYRS